jgi:hypothetical protein
MRTLTIKMYKNAEGNMIFKTESDKKIYDEYIKNLQPDEELEVHFSKIKDNGTYAQLSKLHVSIREIANHTGHTVDEVKDLVKTRAGFSWNNDTDDIEKSFSVMSKEELSLCIQETMNMGMELGLLL